MAKKKKSQKKSSNSSGSQKINRPENTNNGAPKHAVPDEEHDYIDHINDEEALIEENGGYDGYDDAFDETDDEGYYYEEDAEYYPEDNGEESYYDEKASENDSIMPEFLRPFAEKCRVYLSRMDKRLYNTYFLPDEEKLVSPKTTITAFAVAGAVSLLLGLAIMIFLGTYPFYTTGMKTKDFIREFNAMSSDTDIRAILPSYTDVVIPEKAKLGKNPIYLADGHVKLTAKTRFGKILELSVEGVDIPNFNERNYSFLSEVNDDYDYSNDQFYYYIALGKAALAADKLIRNAEAKADNSSASDVSVLGEPDTVPTVYDAATYGYQLYYYAFYYYTNRVNDGYLYVPVGKCYMNFTLSDMTLTVKPTIEKITRLPKGLQSFWDGLTGASRKNDDPSEEPQQSSPTEDQSAVSDSAVSGDSVPPAS